MTGRRVALVAAQVLAFPLLIAALLPIGTLLGGLGSVAAVVFLGAAALYGVLVRRWWACALPLAWAAALLLGLRLADLATSGCSVCDEDSDWSSYPLFLLIVVVLPLTAALVVGVGVGRAWRPLRGPRARPPRSV